MQEDSHGRKPVGKGECKRIFFHALADAAYQSRPDGCPAGLSAASSAFSGSSADCVSVYAL